MEKILNIIINFKIMFNAFLRLFFKIIDLHLVNELKPPGNLE